MHYKAGDYTNCGNLVSRPLANGPLLVPCQRLMPYDGIAMLPTVKHDGVDLPCSTCKYAKPPLAVRLPDVVRYPSR